MRHAMTACTWVEPRQRPARSQYVRRRANEIAAVGNDDAVRRQTIHRYHRHQSQFTPVWRERCIDALTQVNNVEMRRSRFACLLIDLGIARRFALTSRDHADS
jgi:hypothetical protein